MNDSNNAHVELRFNCKIELIPIIRRFVSAFYLQILDDDDVASRMAVATHELLENAAKFAADGVSSLHITVGPSRGQSGHDVTIRTLNRADRDHIATVEKLLEEMHGAAPFDYYQLLMRRNAKRKEGSGLGLARIAAEAEMALHCTVEEDRLWMVAKAHVGAAA